MLRALLGELHGPRLADDGHLDLARVLEVVLDVARDLVREQHGLVVVESLSTRWGTRRTLLDGGEGFCVWFELDVEPQGSGAPAEAEAERRVAATPDEPEAERRVAAAEAD